MCDECMKHSKYKFGEERMQNLNNKIKKKINIKSPKKEKGKCRKNNSPGSNMLPNFYCNVTCNQQS